MTLIADGLRVDISRLFVTMKAYSKSANFLSIYKLDTETYSFQTFQVALLRRMWTHWTRI